MPTTFNDGVRISWNDLGVRSAEPVLLVMGHAFGANMWHRTATALACTHRVLTYENWGLGESETPAGPATIERMAADAVAVMDAAGIDAVHVFGVSMGGLVAQELALSAPDRVGALVLGCTGCPNDHNAPRRAAPGLLYRLPRRLVYRLSRRALYGPAIDRATVLADQRRLLATPTDPAGLVAQSRAIARYRSFDRVPAVQAPTMVLHGDADRIVPLERGRELADRIPGARLEVLPGAGHNFPSEMPDAVHRLLLDFIGEHPLAPRTSRAR